MKCELTNNLVCADEDCKGQAIAKQIFKEKNNVFNTVREDLYKIYIEDMNPLIENSIIVSSGIKNLVDGGKKLIKDLEIRSLHKINDVELQSGETFVMLFQILMPEIKVESNSIKRYTICEICQHNLHKAKPRNNNLKGLGASTRDTANFNLLGVTGPGQKDGANISKPPTLTLMSMRTLANNHNTESNAYLQTNPISTVIHSAETEHDYLNKSNANMNSACKCLKAEISNGDIHFETPLVLNFYYNDSTITSVHYPLNWSISQSQSINLTIFVRESNLKVGKKCFLELRFESFFTKTVQVKIMNKDFNFSFAKSNYLIPFMSENELQNLGNTVANNKPTLP